MDAICRYWSYDNNRRQREVWWKLLHNIQREPIPVLRIPHLWIWALGGTFPLCLCTSLKTPVTACCWESLLGVNVLNQASVGVQRRSEEECCQCYPGVITNVIFLHLCGTAFGESRHFKETRYPCIEIHARVPDLANLFKCPMLK